MIHQHWLLLQRMGHGSHTGKKVTALSFEIAELV